MQFDPWRKQLERSYQAIQALLEEWTAIDPKFMIEREDLYDRLLLVRIDFYTKSFVTKISDGNDKHSKFLD